MSWAVYQRAAVEEEHRRLPSTAGRSVNMEALLAALLETAEIKPFCSCIVAWLTLHQVEAMICIIANPPLLTEPVTSQSDIWAPSQIFGFTLVFRILHIDERKYIMVSKVGREEVRWWEGEQERKEEKSIGKEREWTLGEELGSEDGLWGVKCFRNSKSVFVCLWKSSVREDSSFPSNQGGKWHKRVLVSWYALLCLFFWIITTLILKICTQRVIVFFSHASFII